MKVGDLVKPKHKYSRNEIGLGLIVKVEDDFYRPRITDLYNATGNARLTILWGHGEQTKEPQQLRFFGPICQNLGLDRSIG